MGLKLYNTLSRKKELFSPFSKKAVKLYTCGPTVYRSQHIGNYRTYIFEDVLKRALISNNYRVLHIMNITDVGHLVSDADTGEDKLEREARIHQKSAWDIALFYEKEFISDLRQLNILMPQKLVRATDTIKDQIALIMVLEQKGYTYRTDDGIYFDSTLVKNYGALARRDRKSVRAGVRIEMKGKKNPTDFALWKFSPPHSKLGSIKRQMEWDSPWGIGFPGWHIECSAMCMKYLGETIDIHCGGWDHIQIHHPNEIAQSEAATGKRLSHFWLHSAFLSIKGEKMAKSSPNTNITLETLRDRGFDPLDFRYFALTGHFQKQLSFSWEALQSARNSRIKLMNAFLRLRQKELKHQSLYENRFINSINDNLNTPQALAVLWKAVNGGVSRAFVQMADGVLGLDIKKKALAEQKEEAPLNVLNLVRKRELLRSAKKWHDADKVREKIIKLGYSVKDSENGSIISKSAKL